MSYEVFKPCGGRFGIPRGQLTLSARGMGRFNAKDLEAVGIEDRATLLIDRERRSVALRASIEGEQGVIVGTENGDLAQVRGFCDLSGPGDSAKAVCVQKS